MIRFSFRGLRTAAALLAFIPCSTVFAQSSTTLVVTGTREPLAPDRLAADVAVIDAQTLRNTTADSLADVLRREAGVQLSRNGGPGQSSGVFIRGAASQQTVVLVDGVRIGSATLGSAALESLPLAAIERVEVLRGPGSSLVGADAVGGVVQVFTRRGTDGLQLSARAAVGGYGSRELSGGVRGAQGMFDYAASASSDRSSGTSALRAGDTFGNYNPDRDGYRLDAAQLRVGLRPAEGQRIGLTLLHSHLNAQYDASEYLAPTYAQDNTPDFRTRQTTEVAALDWRGKLTSELSATANASRSVDEAQNGGQVSDSFRTTREQFAAQVAWQTGLIGQLVGALESGTSQARSTSYASAVQRRHHAAVAELTGAVAGWSWQADVRRDSSADYSAVSTGRLGGGVALMPGLRLRALAGTTFRAPSFNDLYYPNYGVANLRPERGRSTEMGLVWQGDEGQASATVYRNHVRDLIGYDPNASHCPPGPGYQYGCAGNTSRARLQGATLSGAQRLGAWALKAQIDFNAANDEMTGQRLPRRAAHQGTLGADWRQGDWTLGASVLRLGARPDGGKVLAAETTLDMNALWRVAPEWQLQAKLLNANNQRVEPARDYQGLGRQAWLVVRYEPKL